MKVIYKTFLSLFIMHLYAYQENLPAPYNTVELLPFVGAGHFGPNQIAGLQHVLNKYKPKIVVEIGSYLGASTRFIAERLPSDGVIYAIDHWLGNPEWFNKPNFQQEQQRYYRQFLSNIIHAKLCHKVVPLRMTSLEAAAEFAVKPDLVFIDGAHDYRSVYEDISAWYKHTYKHGGVLCGDDYHWGAGHPVKRAVDQFAQENKLKVKVINNWFWYYEK